VTLRTRLSRIPLLAWIAGPVALAALIAWPLGGWDTVDLVSREIPEYASNETLHGHRFDIRVDDVWLTDEHPAGYSTPPEPGNVFFIVRAEVTNVTDVAEHSSSLGNYIVPSVSGADEFGSGMYVLVADHTTLPELNPGLPRLIDIVWEIPARDVAPGADQRIEVYDALPRDNSFVFFGRVWDEFLAGIAERNVSER
jgi:hypothetical protein